MSDPIPMRNTVDEELVDWIRQGIVEGRADRIQQGTAMLERFFNHNTVSNYQECIYFHPDDEAFVPDDLPEPELTNIKADVFGDWEFDGEPVFKNSGRL